MSIRVMSQVWEHSKQQGSALLVLLAIADFADDDGYAYPSVERLAAKARMSPRNVRYVLRQLEESGELAIEAGGGRHRSNLYRVIVQTSQAEETRKSDSGKGFQGKDFSETERRETLKNPVETLKSSAETLQPVAAEPSVKTVSKNRHTEPSVSSPAPKGKTARKKPELVPSTEALDTADVLVEAPWIGDEHHDVAAAVERAFSLVRDFNTRDGPYLAEKFIRYRGYQKKPPTDWYRAWLTWLKKELSYGSSNSPATQRAAGAPAARGGHRGQPAGPAEDYDAFVGLTSNGR